LRDSQGKGLLLHKQYDYWQVLAISGGQSIDFVGEWDGEILTPISFLYGSTYHLIERMG
jgi:hypothetical protein